MTPGFVGQWIHSYPAGHDRLLSLFGIEVHWAILQYVLGLPLLAFITRLIYLKTKDEHWERLTRTLVKGFIIVFALGAATGTAAEFGLLLLWPNLTEAAGEFIYFPLYAEIFAFIMEVIFLYMIWYGWNKMSIKAHTAVIFLGLLGAWYSAAMIVSVNAYMVAPTGIIPAYNFHTGTFMYNQGFPKLTLHVPLTLSISTLNGTISVPTLKLLNVTALKTAGVGIVGVNTAKGIAVVEMPARIVQRLVFESYKGYTLKDSILLYVVNKDFIAQHKNLLPVLLNTPVKEILNQIVKRTIRDEGVYLVAFRSPVYRATIMHAYGAAITVSSFTLMGAYAYRYLEYRKRKEKDYLEYIKKAFAFSAVTALIIIAVQGLVLGHEMGKAVAIYNPEKFAAMEATTSSIKHAMTGPFRSLFENKIMPLLAYGSTHAKIPQYDSIPKSYCICKLANLVHQKYPIVPTDLQRGLVNCRPPLIIHYLYYTKIYLATLLGLYALAAVFYVWRRWPNFELPGWITKPGFLVIGLIHLVSFLGWATREIGRKPWTIYGVMTVDVAHTSNPPSALEAGLVATYLLGLLALLAYSVYRFLWVPGRPSKVEG